MSSVNEKKVPFCWELSRSGFQARFKISSAPEVFKRDCNQKRPDVHKIVLSIKLHPPPGKGLDFEDFIRIRTVSPHSGPFSGGGGGVEPNFSDTNLWTQTFLM